MSHRYRYQHGGNSFGPVTATQLRELAIAGKLTSDDLVRRDDMQKWEPASRFKGLFENQATPAEASLSSSQPVMTVAAPAAEKSTIPSGEPEPVLLKAGSMPAGKRLQEQIDKLRPVADRYAKEFEIGTRPFVAALAGAAFLLVLLLSTFLAWEFNSIEMGKVLQGVGNSVYNVGLDFPEGKWVCFFAVLGSAGLAASFIMKRLFPLGLVLAGAAGTCSLLFVFSAFHQISKYNAEILRETRALGKNFEKISGNAEDAKSVKEMLIPREIDESCFGLYLALLSSCIVATAFVFAAFFKPVPVKFMQKESIHPWARQHGALLLAQAAAILLGLVGYIWRY